MNTDPTLLAREACERNKMKAVRFRCRICGKLTAGRVPKGGDHTFRFPRRHLGPNGSPCEGNYHAADWLNVRQAAREKFTAP